jgi:hypothetical protein
MQIPSSHLEHCLELSIFSYTQPLWLAETLLVRTQQMSQTAEFDEQTTRQVYRCLAGHPCAQKDSQQLCV